MPRHTRSHNFEANAYTAWRYSARAHLAYFNEDATEANLVAPRDGTLPALLPLLPCAERFLVLVMILRLFCFLFLPLCKACSCTHWFASLAYMHVHNIYDALTFTFFVGMFGCKKASNIGLIPFFCSPPPFELLRLQASGSVPSWKSLPLYICIYLPAHSCAHLLFHVLFSSSPPSPPSFSLPPPPSPSPAAALSPSPSSLPLPSLSLPHSLSCSRALMRSLTLHLGVHV